MTQPSLKIDFRIVTLLLLIVIAVLIGLWQPWQGLPNHTITITGQGTITATPDEFIFNASYQKTAATLAQAVSDVSAAGNGVVAKLKELGVKDADLKTTVGNSFVYAPTPLVSNQAPDSIARPVPIQPPSSTTAQYTITATLHDNTLATKALDYIATTPVTTSVSPFSDFSPDTRTKLEDQARQKALQNAKQKADQTVSDLGTRLGKVVSVSDLNQFGGPIMLDNSAGGVSAKVLPTTTTPTFEAGSQDLSFSVTVVYQIR